MQTFLFVWLLVPLAIGLALLLVMTFPQSRAYMLDAVGLAAPPQDTPWRVSLFSAKQASQNEAIAADSDEVRTLPVRSGKPEFKHSCVVDGAGKYITLVLQLLTMQRDGTSSWQVQAYTLTSDMRTIDTQQPTMRIHAGTEGFVAPRWDGGKWVEGATKKELAAWEKDHPDQKTLEDVREETLTALSEACNVAIIGGCDVALSDGSRGHFSLQETDQINLTTATAAVGQGAAGYPYHADGQLCKLFPAADILSIATAATTHKLYHTTYCNHLNVWARRVETREELAGITYGAALPADLAANMEEVLGSAQGG